MVSRKKTVLRILGLSRSPRFSPNSETRDAAIFSAVARELGQAGHSLTLLDERDFSASWLREVDVVFSMARERPVLAALAKAEASRRLSVVNSAQALLRFPRAALVELLENNGIPLPRTQLLDLASESVERIYPEDLRFPLWLKRGDGAAEVKDDVCLVRTETECLSALRAFAARRVVSIVAEEHVPGDLVKFYGVEGTDFFYCAEPAAVGGFSKFGLERYNGASAHFSFDVKSLKRQADRAARISNLSVYGGDAVVRADGTFFLIDFNDWPSFSPCRDEAAKAIASRIARAVSHDECSHAEAVDRSLLNVF